MSYDLSKMSYIHFIVMIHKTVDQTASSVIKSLFKYDHHYKTICDIYEPSTQQIFVNKIE